MGLWEFLQQWQGRRTVVGIALSIGLHGLLVVGALWGLGPQFEPQWKPKPGDSLIIELPKPDEPAAAGSRTAASTPPPPPPARVEPRPASPPAPRREAPAPQPREERRVAAAPRPSTPPPPAPRAPEAPLPRVPEAPSAVSEPAPAPREAGPATSDPAPAPPVAEPAPRVAEPAPRTPATGEARSEGSERQVASLPPSGPARPSASDVKAALRAGAGGRGQGRGGIEGDPIPLDSPDGRYSDYLEQVKRKITEKWGYPCVKNARTRECEAITTSLDVQFGILKDGRIQYVEVVRVSDNAVYDEYAVNAILLAQPYPPVPAVMMQAMKAGSTGIPIRARFNYVVETSLTKFLR